MKSSPVWGTLNYVYRCICGLSSRCLSQMPFLDSSPRLVIEFAHDVLGIECRARSAVTCSGLTVEHSLSSFKHVIDVLQHLTEHFLREPAPEQRGLDLVAVDLDHGFVNLLLLV